MKKVAVGLLMLVVVLVMGLVISSCSEEGNNSDGDILNGPMFNGSSCEDPYGDNDENDGGDGGGSLEDIIDTGHSAKNDAGNSINYTAINIGGTSLWIYEFTYQANVNLNHKANFTYDYDAISHLPCAVEDLTIKWKLRQGSLTGTVLDQEVDQLSGSGTVFFTFTTTTHDDFWVVAEAYDGTTHLGNYYWDFRVVDPQ